jgi:hypothetical protein
VIAAIFAGPPLAEVAGMPRCNWVLSVGWTACAIWIAGCSSEESGGSSGGNAGAAGSAGSSAGAAGSGGTAGAGGSAGTSGSAGNAGSAATGPCALGESWELIDDFSYSAAEDTKAYSVAVDGSGTIYAVGSSDVPNGGTTRWLVRKSADGGATWSTVDDYTPTGGGSVANGASATDVAIDATGAIYVLGSRTSAGETERIVRKSSDGGTSWQIVDTFLREPGFPSYGGSIEIGPDGAIFTLGNNGSSAGVSWGVRKSGDAGATWQDDVDYQLTAGKLCFPRGLAIDPAGALYASGNCDDAADVSHWLVRRRDPNGTWTTVDDETPGSAGGIHAGDRVIVAGVLDQQWTVRATSSGNPSFATVDAYTSGGNPSAANPWQDGSGSITVTGTETFGGKPRWITRRSNGGGTSFSTIDDFGYQEGVYHTKLSADATGTLHSGGIGYATGGRTHWLVRRMACQ